MTITEACIWIGIVCAGWLAAVLFLLALMLVIGRAVFGNWRFRSRSDAS